jgi:uncharacterized protein (TIGR03435 family)
MNSRFTYARNTVLTSLVCISFMAENAKAQTQPATTPTYSVATIKPSDPDLPEFVTELYFEPSSFTFTMHNMTLKDAIEFAYDLDADSQVSGGPSWAGSTKFDIVAKAEPDTIAQLRMLTKKQRNAQVEVMVQQLLAERFKLRAHPETRTLPIYDLVVAKGGSKMTLSTTPKDASGAGNMQVAEGFLKGIACRVDFLIDFLQSQPELDKRLIADKTGLTGSYDFSLKWTPDPTGGVDPPSGDSGVRQDPNTPSFFTAIQEQLGLKLVPAKDSAPIIVIDHAEMPSKN